MKKRKINLEFKIKVVKEFLEEHISKHELERKYEIDRHVIGNWVDRFQEHGESYFCEEHWGNNGGNPFAALHTSKNLSREERLEFENLKLRIENERLKKASDANR